MLAVVEFNLWIKLRNSYTLVKWNKQKLKYKLNNIRDSLACIAEWEQSNPVD